MDSNRRVFTRRIAPAERLGHFARFALFSGLVVVLTACGGGGGGSEDGDGGGSGGGNLSPTASFTATPTSGKAPLTVALDAAASSDSDGSITAYAWTFSDGSAAATGVTTSKVFATPGTTITITLTVTDNRGATATTTRQVTVQANTNPTASFVATPVTGKPPLTVNVDATASTDPDGTISSYAWNFGNGTTATGATASVVYGAAGTYTISLTVTDNQGGTSLATRPVTVLPPTGSLDVTVKDSNGGPIPGAAAVATVAGASKSGTTDASGKVLLADVLAGPGTLVVSRDGFVSKTTPVSVPNSASATYEVILERITKAVGGVLTTNVIPGTVAADGKSLEFSIQVVVVDQDSNPISGLTAAAFALKSCTPSATTAAADCVSPLAFDAAYTAQGPGQAPSFQEIPGGAPQPYAATLTFDQSRSIIANDRTDARFYSAKEFLKGLGGNDRAALAAFADNIAAPNGTALIPVKPVTIYPVGSPTFVADGTTLFPTLDSLATLEGGGTPLYQAICEVIDFAAAQPMPAGQRKAAVVFTDGKNEPGSSTYACKTVEQAIDRSKATGVDIFTIGLSGEVDGEALAKLAEGGNGAFLFAEDVSQLIPIYGSLGNLLSRSLTTYKLTYRISTDAAGAFAAGRSVLGTLSVDASGTPINLPFIVRIF